MKVWYLNRTSIRESYSNFKICDTCSFNFLSSECCYRKIFENIHPCCSVKKHYREVTESDIFKL